jgi:hypothetical protein
MLFCDLGDERREAVFLLILDTIHVLPKG